jgi:hypothetical protein
MSGSTSHQRWTARRETGARLDAWARLLWEVFQRHPWSLAATAPARLMGPNALRFLEVAVAALDETNLSGDERTQAVIAILMHVRGMAVAALEGQGRWDAMIAELLGARGDEFPALRAAQRAGAFGALNGHPLDFGLGLLLDGLSARIAGRDRGP